MNLIQKTVDKSNDYLVDHPKTKSTFVLLWKILVTMISAFIFAYGFRAFIAPTQVGVEGWFPKVDGLIPENIKNMGITEADYTTPLHLISGGASGFSQMLIRFVEIFVDITSYEKTITSVLYLLLNIPLLILSWRKISKQFTFFTLLNVLCVSLFNQIIPDAWIYKFVNLYTDIFARCIFGGLTTGLSSALAMLIGSSAGGSDIISIYISEKKSAPVGKYAMAINAAIILLYTLFSVIGNKVNPAWNQIESNKVISLSLYTIVYYFIAVKVMDFLNVRNRKMELQIITTKEELSQIMIHAFPHACTICEAKGAFSGAKRYIMYMVIGKPEAKKAIKIVRQADPSAFVTIQDLNQVYGRFYIKPLD